MDLDALVVARAADWEDLGRLAARARRPRRLAGADVDALVAGYQRVSADLAAVRGAGGDPVLEARLSRVAASARSGLSAAGHGPLRAAATLLGRDAPAAVWRLRWWWCATAAGSLLLALAVGTWIAADPGVQAAVAPPAEVRTLVDHDFAAYYRSAPAASLAAKIWTNNAWVAAGAIAGGVLLGLPTLLLLLVNDLNLGVVGGLLVAHGRTGLFLGLITPHGLLELAAVFLAAAAGLRLGWTALVPGDRPRGTALAVEGRAAGAVAAAAALALAISGAIEAFVTPSALPVAVRVGIGVVAAVGVVATLLVRGRRAVRTGAVGDLDEALAGRIAPSR